MIKARRLLVVAVRSVCMMGAGFLAGVLTVCLMLHSLGAFRADARPITIRPVVDLRTPTATPRPTRTPEPTATWTPEEMKQDRDEWRLLLPTPYAEASNAASRGRVREFFFHLGADARDEKEWTCPDCYRTEKILFLVTGPLEDLGLSVTLVLDWRRTQVLRRFNGIGERTPFDDFAPDRG